LPLLRDRARSLRRDMTEAERALWYLLRSRRFSGFKFRRQMPIGQYIADVVCPECRLIVEADGGQHAESTYDERRDGWLKLQGFRVLRFWNFDILRKRDEVSETLWHCLNDPGAGETK
jgi:very-short-patch-repair endonuclease